MLIPGVRVHVGKIDVNDYEQLLFNTLRYQLEGIIGTYLRQTRQSHPIHSVFDMSHI